jgi:hypothetical protein
LCPRYRIILREKGAKDTLDMVKGTPSNLEKYRVLLDGGEGVVMESVPMHDLMDEAKANSSGNSYSWYLTSGPCMNLQCL